MPLTRNMNDSVDDALAAPRRRREHALLAADDDAHIALGRVRDPDDLIDGPDLDADTAAGMVGVEDVDDGELGAAHESVLGRADASRDGRQGARRTPARSDALRHRRQSGFELTALEAPVGKRRVALPRGETGKGPERYEPIESRRRDRAGGIDAGGGQRVGGAEDILATRVVPHDREPSAILPIAAPAMRERVLDARERLAGDYAEHRPRTTSVDKRRIARGPVGRCESVEFVGGVDHKRCVGRSARTVGIVEDDLEEQPFHGLAHQGVVAAARGLVDQQRPRCVGADRAGQILGERVGAGSAGLAAEVQARRRGVGDGAARRAGRSNERGEQGATLRVLHPVREHALDDVARLARRAAPHRGGGAHDAAEAPVRHVRAEGRVEVEAGGAHGERGVERVRCEREHVVAALGADTARPIEQGAHPGALGLGVRAPRLGGGGAGVGEHQHDGNDVDEERRSPRDPKTRHSSYGPAPGDRQARGWEGLGSSESARSTMRCAASR